MFKVNNRNTRKKCEICSKLTIKTPERRQLFEQVNVSWGMGEADYRERQKYGVSLVLAILAKLVVIEED